MLAPSPRTNIKRRGSAPQLPQSILAGAAGTGGEILVPHHESPMHARRGLSLSLPSDIEASGAAGEIFVPHHDTNVSTRRRVSLTLTDVGTVSGAAGEIFVPHQDTAVSERRRVSLTLGEGILQSGNGGAAGEIFVPHHETPMQTRRRVSLSLGDVAASASGAAGEIFVPHHETPMQTRRNLGGLTLPADVIENSDGASGEMFILNTSGSSQVNEGNMNASRSTTSSGTSGTPLSARRGGKHLSLPGVIVLESQRTGGAAGEMLQLAKTSSELARRRGSDLALPESLVREGGGAAGEMLDVNPNGPLAVGSSPDKAMSFGTPNSDRPSTAARARAKEALSEFNARPIDDRVHELTAALMREYVARHATESTELRDAFERRFPRTDGTVTKRSVICGALGVPEGSREDASILERLVRSLLENNNTENAAARFQRNVESRQSSGPSSLFNSNARFAEDESMEQQASLGDVASKSLCFNMTDDGSGVAINGLNVTDKTSAAIFRLKSLDELDLSNAEVIGKGAGGRVLRATRVATGEQLAVKEIFLNNEDTVKQIQSEVSIMWGTTNRHKSHVPSPYLVNCEGIFFQGGTLLIAMELMDGSLKDALDAHGPFNEEQVKAMAFQMLQGLLYMHFEKKQLHRDIKPHNILYNRDGWVKLSDFGIASDKMANTVSGAQTFCGTLVYMSPNRAEGATYGFEGDLWSLGITLYQLASGKLPIGNSIFEVMQLRTNPPKLPMAPPMTTPPSVRRPYSAPFNAFMDACLDPNATSGSVSARDLLKCEWMQDMTLAKSQKIVQDVFKEVMTRTQRKQAGLNAVGLGKRDDLFATLDEALM